jgi:hypothetical protein
MHRVDAIHRLRAKASKPDSDNAAIPVQEITMADKATFRMPKTVVLAAAAAAGSALALVLLLAVVAATDVTTLVAVAIFAAHDAWVFTNQQAQIKRTADKARCLGGRRKHRFNREKQSALLCSSSGKHAFEDIMGRSFNDILLELLCCDTRRAILAWRRAETTARYCCGEEGPAKAAALVAGTEKGSSKRSAQRTIIVARKNLPTALPCLFMSVVVGLYALLLLLYYVHQ